MLETKEMDSEAVKVEKYIAEHLLSYYMPTFVVILSRPSCHQISDQPSLAIFISVLIGKYLILV